MSLSKKDDVPSMLRVANKCIQSNYPVHEGDQITTQSRFSCRLHRYDKQKITQLTQLRIDNCYEILRSRAHEFACASGFRGLHKKSTNKNDCAVTSVRNCFIKSRTTCCCAVNRSFDNQQNTDAKTVYFPPLSPKEKRTSTISTQSDKPVWGEKENTHFLNLVGRAL